MPQNNIVDPAKRAATAAFCRSMRSLGLRPVTVNYRDCIGLWLIGGLDVPALAIAEGPGGSWLMLDRDAQFRVYGASEVL